MAETTPTLYPIDEAILDEQTSALEDSAEQEEEEEWDEELEEELIIEDFTIDGICGVY